MEKFRGEVFLVHKGIVDLNKLKEPIAEVRPHNIPRIWTEPIKTVNI
jgi:tryptophanase